MNTGFAGQLHKRGVWGALLVLAGVALLAAQLSGEWEISLREWWPAIFVLVGIGKLLDYPNPKRVAKGVLLVSIGLWVLACKAQIWGLTFATSWPFVLIAVGAALVLSSFLRMRLQQSDTSHHAS